MKKRKFSYKQELKKRNQELTDFQMRYQGYTGEGWLYNKKLGINFHHLSQKSDSQVFEFQQKYIKNDK